MRKINLIDLDGTLINYDSFRELVFRELKRLNLSMFFLTLLRLMKILNSAKYKSKTILAIAKNRDEQYFIDFATEIYSRINTDVLKEIHRNSDSNTINVLISASPNIYVKHVINMLSWEGSGSFYVDGRFNHLYGKNKLNWVKKEYPVSKYDFNFAISDSRTDLELLKYCSYYCLVHSVKGVSTLAKQRLD